MSNFKKPKRHSRKSLEADKKKSMSDIEKTRRKLQAIEGRELESIRVSARDMIELNRAIQDLDKNKALIEDTYKGTSGQKPSTWFIKSKRAGWWK